MKYILWVIASSLIFISSATAQNFYDPETICTLQLNFNESNWDQILDEYYEDGDDERLVGQAIINGVVYESVGVKYKGNSSYSASRVKNPLNVKLDHIIDDQDHLGFGTLKLANCYKDPSFVREILGYEIGGKYLPASGVGYIDVTINGQHMGLYTNVQSVDKDFIEGAFGNRDNTLFKGDFTGHGPGILGAKLIYQGADSTSYFNNYELQSDYGWNELVALCDTLNNYTESIDEVLDVDRLLWFLAVHNTLVSLDSPISAPHNFYFYRDQDRLFNFLFWDLNMTFGTFRLGGPGGPPTTLAQLQQLDPFYNATNSEYPILSQTLESEKHQLLYIAHMKTILAENFSNDWYLTRGEELQSVIDSAVQADPNKFYTYNEFLQNLYVEAGEWGIQELMDGRQEWLLSQPGFTALAPDVQPPSLSLETASPGDIVNVTVQVTDATEVYLRHRQTGSFRFAETTMFDDGNHEDGAAGDGLYGCTLEAGSLDVQYHIRAFNTLAATVYPARAAYQNLVLPVIGLVTINEFLAANDSDTPDQNGEYDDWIELYNGSGTTVDLAGYYLTDDENEPDQWAFPVGTVMEPGEYLMIWADNDEEQDGLHTGFKLSATGETILLSSPTLAAVSRVDFGIQEADVSTGRYPDGTGDFVVMSPSFGGPNYSGILDLSGIPHVVDQKLVLLPNHPNPFNPMTIISFELPSSGYTRLDLFDARGRHLKSLVDGSLSSGPHTVTWQGDDHTGRALASGVYFSRLIHDGQIEYRSMTLAR